MTGNWRFGETAKSASTQMNTIIDKGLLRYLFKIKPTQLCLQGVIKKIYIPDFKAPVIRL